MKTWILILTIFGSDGTAIHSVPGFTQQRSCMDSAKLWITQTKSVARYPKGVSAVCVLQK